MKQAIKATLSRIGLLETAKAARNGLSTLTTPIRYRGQARQCRANGIGGGFPIPPPRLTYLVSGHCDVRGSLANGTKGAKAIADVMEKHGRSIDGLEAVLDFGCGSGRVIRNWGSLPQGVVHGTDYNQELVDWCSSNLLFADFSKNELQPPLRYEDDQFDLIYVLSVFTHLDEELQFSWLRELLRICRPGGVVLITTHGEKFYSSLTNEEQETWNAGELVVRLGSRSGENACAIYHPPAYIRETVAPTVGAEVLDFVPEGAVGNGGQDMWLLKKPLSA